ncbi:hypothetical protein ACFYQA_13385 [Streptomyces sp. NPDC005774]|uniref:hypothetical protein n=1 Tax=Streptomyces sp. NPDC005774 TaxID=3364728 RepID=UPI0036C08663
MPEPWNDCAADSQRFGIERAEDTDGWRLRPETGDGMCVGIHRDADETGAAAVVEVCSDPTTAGNADSDPQVFLIGRG